MPEEFSYNQSMELLVEHVRNNTFPSTITMAGIARSFGRGYFCENV